MTAMICETLQNIEDQIHDLTPKTREAQALADYAGEHITMAIMCLAMVADTERLARFGPTMGKWPEASAN